MLGGGIKTNPTTAVEKLKKKACVLEIQKAREHPQPLTGTKLYCLPFVLRYRNWMSWKAWFIIPVIFTADLQAHLNCCIYYR